MNANLVDPAVSLERLAAIDPGGRKPQTDEIERAGVYLASLPRPDQLYRPAVRAAPRGRRHPTRDDFPAPADMYADLRDARTARTPAMAPDARNDPLPSDDR